MLLTWKMPWKASTVPVWKLRKPVTGYAEQNLPLPEQQGQICHLGADKVAKNRGGKL